MLEPDSSFLGRRSRANTNEIELILYLLAGALADTLHVFAAVKIYELGCRCEWTQSEALVEFSFNDLYLNKPDNTFVIHVCDMVVALHAKVWAGYYLADLQEVETFESDGIDLLLIVDEMELVKAFSLIIYLNPCIICQVCQNLILCLQAKLLTEFATRLGTHYIVLAGFAGGGFERALHVVEDSEAILSTALEVSITDIGDADCLLSSFQLFDNLQVRPVKNLNVPLIQSNNDKSVVARGVEDLELARHLLLQLQILGTEEVQLITSILAH